VNVNDVRPSIAFATLLISKTPGGYSTSNLQEWFECSPEYGVMLTTILEGIYRMFIQISEFRLLILSPSLGKIVL
jgi:hypothetical protein